MNLNIKIPTKLAGSLMAKQDGKSLSSLVVELLESMIPNVLEKKRMLEIKTQMELQHFITRKVKCDVSGLSGYQRLFLIEIADRVNHKHSFEKQWRCWPSVEGIGKCIGLGKTKTNEIIGSLCKLGVL